MKFLNLQAEDFTLGIIEAVVSRLPPDDQEKIRAARESLREMIKLDPPTMRIAIGLVAQEGRIYAAKTIEEAVQKGPAPV